MSGSGKSTLAAAVGAHVAATQSVEILDGDVVRTHLSKGLGFSREDRDINVHRIGFVARLLAKHDVFVIIAAISPYAEARAAVRALADQEHVRFVEVFVNASLESLVRRDVKGLYRRALAGEIPHFTGISDPYEPPPSPDVVVHTDVEAVEQSTETILRALTDRGLLQR
jgi:adenylylsulfate kinase